MKKDNNGFTLIEILVTISILALIAIIAVPTIIKVNKQTKEKLLNTKINEAEEATILWAQDNASCLLDSNSNCMININDCEELKDESGYIISNVKKCMVTLGELASNNLIKYDDDESNIILSPVDNTDMTETKIEFTYNTATKMVNLYNVNFVYKTTSKKKTTKKTTSTSTSTTSTTSTTTTTTSTTSTTKSTTTTKTTTTTQSNKLIVAIRKNYPTISTPKTTPGLEVSTYKEALLASTKDDYGTSYYFRGFVTKNYVLFANKCWRIVRITGNGAIKLVLHNDNINEIANPCDYNDSKAAYARYYGVTYTSKFNSAKNNNAYVGFMYGTPGSSTYALAHANKNDSTVLTNLKKWYDLSFDAEQKSKLADTIWCNDKSTYNNQSYNPWNIGTLETNYGVNSNTNYYSATSRLVSSSGSAGGIGPTLVCPVDNSGGNLSKHTAKDIVYGNGALNGYKIGLLSADEVAFAGGAWNKENYSYYLYENANSNYWWTLSPSYCNVGTNMFIVGGPGNVYISSGNENGGLRPAVSLISSITISGGIGTASNPFVVN